ncbi:GAF domain-containing protein [bacterium]|nr:GAF domain-containing protein [bacterium]
MDQSRPWVALPPDLDLERRAELEALVAQISVSFSGLPPDKLDAAIIACLAEIGAFVGADRSYVFLYDLTARTLSNTHEWCAEGISAQRDNLQNLEMAGSAYFLDPLEGGGILEIPVVEDLPPEAGSVKETLLAQGIKSLIVVPLHDNSGTTIGFTGFDAVNQARPWYPTDWHLLQVVSNLIGSALEHRALWLRLERSEAHNRAILDALPDTLVMFSARGQILDLLIGRDDPNFRLSAKLFHKDLYEFLGPDMAPVLEDVVERVKMGETPAVANFVLKRNQRKLSFEVRVTPYGRGDYLALVRDVTQRAKDEKALRSLALQLDEAEEAQRGELAQLLHDTIGQDLTGMHFQLQSCLQDGVADPERLRMVINLLRDTMHKTQDLTFDLSPPMLYELGLPAALQALARKFERNHGIPCRLALKGRTLPPGAPGSVLLYRITGELLTNSLKHSGCTKIEIILSCTESEIRLMVADDGRGFDQSDETKEGPWKEGGFGLFSIRQRLEPLGGTMRAHAGRGARITINLPRV